VAMRSRRRGRVAAAAAAVALFALTSACASSGGKRAAIAPKAGVAATTTTEPTAIGLRTNGDEQAEKQPDRALSPAARRLLANQLVVARQAALKYPTVADAARAGYILAGKFTPGAGAHYISMSDGASQYLGKAKGLDPAHPLAIIYDGTFPTSRVVGLMYGSFAPLPPEGFAGPNDHWHRHSNLCITFEKGKIGIPFAPDSSVTQAQCDALHGDFMRESLWMVHAWVVPGWDSPDGVFSHANVDLHCGDGTDHTDSVGFCVGAKQ
jgi:hypothetical protein